MAITDAETIILCTYTVYDTYHIIGFALLLTSSQNQNRQSSKRRLYKYHRLITKPGDKYIGILCILFTSYP